MTLSRQLLEVKPQDYLDHAATDIIRGGEVLISDCGLTKSRPAEISYGGIRGGLTADLEVNVVKGVQELSAHLEVHRF